MDLEEEEWERACVYRGEDELVGTLHAEGRDLDALVRLAREAHSPAPRPPG